MIDKQLYFSPLGILEAECEGATLTALRFATAASEAASSNLPADVRRWLDCYFGGGQPVFTPKLKLQGTAFQQRVWNELLTIPYGQTATYGELARRLGCRSAQAVGQAVGRNPIAVVVPCHRVVGADGSLTGYAYGIELKRRLLELEGARKGRCVQPLAKGISDREGR